MSDSNNNMDNNEDEKTVLLDDEEQKTVLLDKKDIKTVPLDEEECNDTVSLGSENDRCMGCMEKIPAGTDICPHCGFSLKDHDAKIHQMQPGSLLADRYIVGRVIGEGGFGITYMGFDKKLDIRVAIKEYFPHGMVMRDTTGDRGNNVSAYGGKNKDLYEKYLSRFFSEARTLAKLQNIDGVVRVQDYFSANDTAYIIMEYVDGRDLKQYAREKGGKLSVNEALELFYPVANALSKLHKNNIIHRDISPDNIMVTKDGKVTIIDLGASREFGDMQKSMSVLLKPGYAPLEQYNSSEKQGAYTDIYAFCASFYRVITGKTPPDIVDRIENECLKTPTELGISIDPNVENALMKGLSIHPADRFQSMDELMEVFYGGKAMERAVPSFKTPEKTPSVSGDDKNSPDIVDGSKGVEPVEKAEGKRNKLPIVIIAGAVLAGIVTFLIVFLNMSSKNNVVIVDSNGNTIEVAQTDSSQTGDNTEVQTTAADKKDLKQVNVQPIAQRSAQADPASILHDGGTISRNSQKDTFDFVTPREGRYRVEVGGMPSSMSVDLAFVDPKGEVVGEEKGCRNGNGVTVKDLLSNTTYRIQVTQNSGTGNYSLNVGIQKPTPDITQLTRIDDSVEYTDQRNLYNFVVPKDGTYRFELSGLGSDVDTSMLIFDDPGNKISEDENCRNGEGLTLADVKAGTIYEIQVRQNNGFSSYSLNVGQQKDRVDIANKTCVTDSMEFTDQCNIYSFNATSSGSVTFTLSEMPSDMSVEMYVTDDQGNNMAAEANVRNDSGISIKDVAAGSHYYVKIVQSVGKGGYSLTVD